MLPETKTKGWPKKKAGWEQHWHPKLFGVPTSCDGMGLTKSPNSWTAHWRSPAGSKPMPVFLQCLGLPTEHPDIWRGLGCCLDIPYPSHTALQAQKSIVGCPGKWTGRSTPWGMGRKAHSTSKCLPSRCTDPPLTKDYSSWTCRSKMQISGSRFYPWVQDLVRTGGICLACVGLWWSSLLRQD